MNLSLGCFAEAKCDHYYLEQILSLSKLVGNKILVQKNKPVIVDVWTAGEAQTGILPTAG